MEVELQRTLSLEEERDCKTLLSLCNLEEEHPYDTDLDYDFFYLIRNEGEKETGIAEGILALLMGYKLGEQQGGKDVLLCLAFVHPKMRGQGLFTQCKESLMDDFRNCVFRFMKKGEREEEFWKRSWKKGLRFREKREFILTERFIFLPTMKKHFTFTDLWWKIGIEVRERERRFFGIALKKERRVPIPG